jgi:hypothetical protein
MDDREIEGRVRAEVADTCDWWEITTRDHKRIHVVYGKTEQDARINALRNITVRKTKQNEGTYGAKRLTPEQFAEFLKDNPDL